MKYVNNSVCDARLYMINCCVKEKRKKHRKKVVVPLLLQKLTIQIMENEVHTSTAYTVLVGHFDIIFTET